jgi:hypothetical protein
MSFKLKALGLALLASLAVGAVSVISATANPGEKQGHFTSDAAGPWTHITGVQEGSPQENGYIDHVGGFTTITCTAINYTASVSTSTATEITVTPDYTGCETEGGSGFVHFDMNGCALLLTIFEKPETKDQTMHLECPAGKEMTLTNTGPFGVKCTIHIPPQTPTTGGVVYTTTTSANKKHTLTLDITAIGITSTRTEEGFGGCLFKPGHGNNNTFIGKAAVEGVDTAKNVVNITATQP